MERRTPVSTAGSTAGKRMRRMMVHSEVATPGHVEVVLRNTAYPFSGVDHHRPDGADKNGPARCRLRFLEQQQADRQPGQRADRTQERDQRVEHARERRGTPPPTPPRRPPPPPADPDAAAPQHRHPPPPAPLCPPLAIKRIGKQGHGRIERAERRRKAFTVYRRQLPEHHQQAETEQRRDDAL